ncbi:hypothetical protein CVV68_22720 [Arthrobacter livingstonensis]|uniref:Uncharacterized protein n=1 Tax=Arthrobacter livingstonensis TaxID=670078 RepID=A0A2V5KZF1_9MICC|nr:hypothetical protein CVV68_22720 [Arthrobacter livingstonensis]
MLVTMVCSTMTGATTLVEMVESAFGTARTQLAALVIGAPHAPTLGSVFERLDAQFLEPLAGAWAHAATAPSAVSLDAQEVWGATNGRGSRGLSVKNNPPGLHVQRASPPLGRVRGREASMEMASGRDIVRTAKFVSIAAGTSFLYPAHVAEIKRRSRRMGTRPWHTETV